MRLLLGLPGFFLFFNFLLAQETVYLPQVANGTYEGGSMRTTFVLFNPQCYGWSDFVTIHLTDDAGQPMIVTIPGRGTASEFGPIRVAGGQTVIFQTDGSGNLTTGAARVETAMGWAEVAAIFTLYDTAQHFVTEAGVGASQLLQDFVIPVDATGQFNTGVALFNPGNTDASVTFVLLNTDGTQATTVTQTLKAGAHLAKFVAGQGSLFPAVSNLRGSLSISSSVPIAAVTLRQNGSPLSNTTLPVVAKTALLNGFYLAQVANGQDASGLKMRTTFILFNISATTANVTVDVRKQDGSEFQVTIPDGVANNSGTFTRSLAPGGAAFLQTDGSGPLAVGSARVISNVPIGVCAIFTLYNGTTFLTEAGVGNSRQSSQLALPVDVSPTFGTGVALFRGGDEPTTVTFQLLDGSGQKIAESAPIVMEAWSQRAEFVSEIFPGQGTFRGLLVIISTRSVSAITLRQNNSPIGYTTLPVGSRVCSGETTPTSKLLPAAQTPLTLTSDTTLDVTLPAGFELSGFVRGDVQQASVTASSSGGQLYRGTVNQYGKYYSIFVPAGTYTLGLCCRPGAASDAWVSIPYVDPTPVQVNADTTRDIKIPPVALSNVSGTLSGLNQLPANKGVYVQMTAGNPPLFSEALVGADGSFQLKVPNGMYTASLFMRLTSSQQSDLEFFNVGSVTVNGNQTSNLQVPAFSIVSGTVTNAGATGIAADTRISSTDSTRPAISTNSCGFFAGSVLGFVAPSNGAYALYVPNGRAQTMIIDYPVGDYGYLEFPWPGRQIPALTGNRTENFTAPALPGTVTISGKVTDPQGKGVKNVYVNATSEQITGVTGALFDGWTATTDSNGRYALKVLSGTGYTLTFTPPEPQP